MTAEADEGIRVRLAPLKTVVATIFERASVPAPDARFLAGALVRADARGMHSHGVQRVGQYLRKMTAGGIRTDTHGAIVSERGSVVVIDGEDGIGQILSRRAMQMAIGKAREFGVGVAVVRNSNHHGESGYFATMAADAGMIGIVTSNGSPSTPAWGGSNPRVTGPWPLAIAAAGQGDPVVLDMSLGVVSKGRIQQYANMGRKIPIGWGFDRNGTPTDDPKQVLDGGWSALIGDYKGWGLLLMIEVLTGVLSGGRVAGEITDLFTGPAESPQGLSHFLMAIDISASQPIERFRSRMAQMQRMLKGSTLAQGFDEVILPGERESRSEREAHTTGVLLARRVAREIVEAARKAECPPQVLRDAFAELL